MSWERGVNRQLLPWFQALFALAKRMDRSARITSSYRSRAEQIRLYRRYLAGQSRFPAAPPGHSMHQYGRAIDIVARPEVLRRLGELWEGVGGRWGGRVRDPIHFDA